DIGWREFLSSCSIDVRERPINRNQTATRQNIFNRYVIVGLGQERSDGHFFVIGRGKTAVATFRCKNLPTAVGLGVIRNEGSHTKACSWAEHHNSCFRVGFGGIKSFDVLLWQEGCSICQRGKIVDDVQRLHSQLGAQLFNGKFPVQVGHLGPAIFNGACHGQACVGGSSVVHFFTV